MLSSSYLPATLIPACLDVLLKGTTERDFVRIVVELVQSLQADSEVVTSEEEPEDSDDSDEEVAIAMGKGRVSGKGVRGEERVQRRKELDFRCLTIVKALLERVMVVCSPPSTSFRSSVCPHRDLYRLTSVQYRR